MRQCGRARWPDVIPYPVFAIGAHIFLDDCPIQCGPTAAIPGSYKFGRPPPAERRADAVLTCDGQGALPLTAQAGDVALFVSDVWHRRCRPEKATPAGSSCKCITPDATSPGA